MFRTVQQLVAGIALVGLSSFAVADDKEKKEVTLKGDVLCAKCALKVSQKCATALRVKDGDKDVVYYFDADSAKKYHDDICSDTKPATVTGKVTEKDGKKTIMVSKVEFKDEKKK